MLNKEDLQSCEPEGHGAGERMSITRKSRGKKSSGVAEKEQRESYLERDSGRLGVDRGRKLWQGALKTMEKMQAIKASLSLHLKLEE